MRPPAVDLAERALGRRIETWSPVANRIAGPEARWRVELSGGGAAFVKGSWNDESAGWLRDEHRVYAGSTSRSCRSSSRSRTTAPGPCSCSKTSPTRFGRRRGRPRSSTGEGGPAPGTILRHQEAAELAALLAGFFCSRAGLPAPPHLPRLRELQLLRARTALPWAAEALGLPPPRAAPPAP